MATATMKKAALLAMPVRRQQLAKENPRTSAILQSIWLPLGQLRRRLRKRTWAKATLVGRQITVAGASRTILKDSSYTTKEVYRREKDRAKSNNP